MVFADSAILSNNDQNSDISVGRTEARMGKGIFQLKRAHSQLFTIIGSPDMGFGLIPPY